MTHDALYAWLDRHGARKLWSQKMHNLTFTLVAYDVGKAIVVAQLWDDGGWELFVPASLDTKIDATLAAAEKALGL